MLVIDGMSSGVSLLITNKSWANKSMIDFFFANYFVNEQIKKQLDSFISLKVY